MPRWPHALAVAAATLLVLSLSPARAGEPDALPAVPRAEAEAAVAKGLVLARKAASNYPNHRDCFACHHQTLPMLAVATARGRGIGRGADDAAFLREQAEFTLQSFE